MEIIDRIKADTPDFHKKTINWCLVFILIVGGVIGLHEGEVIELPAQAVTILYLAEVVLTSIAGTAKTAKKDPDAKV